MEKIVELMDYSINKLKKLINKNDMKLHEINNFYDNEDVFLFKKMRVESGYMYRFSDKKENGYKEQWVFVPDSSERVKKLEHHRDTTVGLWATDRPDLIDDPKKLLFEIKD